MSVIVRSSLHQEVVERLRDVIVEGELAPGDRINERELCERFGVSRTPLREALKVMASEGLVVLLPNRGARVARITRRDIEDVYQVMATLEGLSGELACARISDEGINEIRALHYEMLAYHARRDLQGYYRLNEQIHRTIMESAENPVLTSIYGSLAKRIRRTRFLAAMPYDWWDQAVREHGEILEALTARDGKRLSELLKAHLERKIDLMMRSGIVDTELEAALGEGEPPV